MVHTNSRIAASLIFLLGISACTYTPFGNDNRLTGSPLGTAVGAGVGAGAGYVIGGSSESLALLGGLAGGTIGYYVTTLRFASGGVIQAGGQVYTLGDYATIEIPTDNLFDANSDEFLYEAGPALDSAVAVLNRYPNNNIMVSGNTSGFGTTKWEKQLSEARARQVAAYLWAHGINNFKCQSIDKRKLTYVGYGNYFPIANNIRAKSIRENSRIQITAYPSKADLHLDKRHQVFHNIGGLDEPAVQPNHPTSNIDNEFSGDELPEQTGTRRADFKDTFNEDRKNTSYIPERANVKGEAFTNQNRVSGEFKSSVSKNRETHRNLKGEV